MADKLATYRNKLELEIEAQTTIIAASSGDDADAARTTLDNLEQRRADVDALSDDAIAAMEVGTKALPQWLTQPARLFGKNDKKRKRGDAFSDPDGDGANKRKRPDDDDGYETDGEGGYDTDSMDDTVGVPRRDLSPLKRKVESLGKQEGDGPDEVIYTELNEYLEANETGSGLTSRQIAAEFAPRLGRLDRTLMDRQLADLVDQELAWMDSLGPAATDGDVFDAYMAKIESRLQSPSPFDWTDWPPKQPGNGGSDEDRSMDIESDDMSDSEQESDSDMVLESDHESDDDGALEPKRFQGTSDVKSVTFAKLWNGEDRPKGTGVVIVKKERFYNARFEKTDKHYRHLSTEGIVVPMETASRSAAPEPESTFRVSQANRRDNNRSAPDLARNNGRPDMHKGHTMALELGGPDDAQAIVPQWAQWQANGAWRAMELEVVSKARDLPDGHRLLYKATSEYEQDALHEGSFDRQTVPARMHVDVIEVDGQGDEVKGGWRLHQIIEAQQDATDARMMNRADDDIDSTGNEYSDHERKKPKAYVIKRTGFDIVDTNFGMHRRSENPDESGAFVDVVSHLLGCDAEVCRRALQAHEGNIEALRVLGANHDTTFFVVDRENGRLLRTHYVHTGGSQYLALLREGDQFSKLIPISHADLQSKRATKKKKG